MGKFLDILEATTVVGLNYMAKADDEKKNREYAKRMGWSEDGIMVALMNHNSESRRKKNGYRF